jgi:hypothetical protein
MRVLGGGDNDGDRLRSYFMNQTIILKNLIRNVM